MVRAAFKPRQGTGEGARPTPPKWPGTALWGDTNTFARESHIDILANKVGVDPVEFRLSHLTDKRMRRVLKAAAKQFGWKSGRTPSGRGVGVACAIYMGTYVATMRHRQPGRLAPADRRQHHDGPGLRAH